MALPADANPVHTPGSPVPSAEFNLAKQCIVGAKHGPITRRFVPKPLTLGSFSWNANLYLISAAGAQAAFIPLDEFKVGDRILQVDVRAYGDGAVDCTHALATYVDSISSVVLANVADNNRAAAYGTFNVFTGTYTLLAAEVLWLVPVANAANYRISSIAITHDRP